MKFGHTTVYLLDWRDRGGLVYVGQTRTRLSERLSQHRRRPSLIVRGQLAAHGEPVVRVVAEGLSFDEANRRERAEIRRLGSVACNVHPGGRHGGTPERTMSPECAQHFQDGLEILRRGLKPRRS